MSDYLYKGAKRGVKFHRDLSDEQLFLVREADKLQAENELCRRYIRFKRYYLNFVSDDCGFYLDEISKADAFMICNGNGEWAAYGQSLAGNWKIRQNSGWEVNRGGTFAERGTAFEAVPDGDNINVGDITGFDIIYDSKAETITVK